MIEKENEGLASKDRVLDGIRLGLFDWSGVISDDRIPVHEANMRMFDSFGLARLSLPDWLLLTKQSPREFFAAAGIDLSSEEIFQQYKVQYSAVVNEGILPNVYPNASESLAKLSERGVRLAVISSHPEGVLMDEAIRYGVLDFFDTMKGSSIDKAFDIATITAGLGFLPGEVFYIGDTIYDIQSARKAQTRAVAITTGYHNKQRLEEEQPDFLIDSLSELLAD